MLRSKSLLIPTDSYDYDYALKSDVDELKANVEELQTTISALSASQSSHNGKHCYYDSFLKLNYFPTLEFLVHYI